MTISDAQKRATAKYQKKNYETILFRMKKNGEITRDVITRKAEQAGETVNAYITESIRQRINNDDKNKPISL